MDSKTVDDKSFKCDVCGARFRLMKYLKKHQNIHEMKLYRFECQPCKKSLSTGLILDNICKYILVKNPFFVIYVVNYFACWGL